MRRALRRQWGRYLRYAGVGAIAGIRSMSAPALVSERLQRRRFLGRSLTTAVDPRSLKRGLEVLAVMEAVADKIPGLLPARTVLPSFLARVASGGVSAAALASADRRGWPMGAALGMAAAGMSTVVIRRIRQRLTAELQLPDAFVGMLEDGVVQLAGRAILRE